MSIFDRFKESAGAGATILGFVGIIGSVAVYGTNLKNQFDASQTKIVQLETQVATLRDQLDKSYDSTAETSRGPKGDKGDPGERGEQGPRGERGPQGEAGPQGTSSAAGGLTESQIRQIVEEAIKQRLASLPVTNGVTASLGGQDVFKAAGCIQISSVSNLSTLNLRPTQEFCDKEGKLIGRVGLEDSSTIAWKKIGGANGYCDLETHCDFDGMFGGEYIYERFGEDETGPVFLLRRV